MIDSAECKNPIEDLFSMFTEGAMVPRAYNPKRTIPKTVTLFLRPEQMKLLNIISDRIGSSRANVAQYIVDIALYSAAIGCGFHPDENYEVPKKELVWDTRPKSMGFSHVPAIDEE